jgi:hypothetical protein
MKRTVQLLVAAILLGSLTVGADPFKTWNWTAPTEYENNTPIPAADVLSYNLYCGTAEGGPYETYAALLDASPPSIQDMGALVQNTPGTYYCVATATSVLNNTESAYSNEVNFTVLPTDLGLIPKPPVLSLG